MVIMIGKKFVDWCYLVIMCWNRRYRLDLIGWFNVCFCVKIVLYCKLLIGYLVGSWE